MTQFCLRLGSLSSESVKKDVYLSLKLIIKNIEVIAFCYFINFAPSLFLIVSLCKEGQFIKWLAVVGWQTLIRKNTRTG